MRHLIQLGIIAVAISGTVASAQTNRQGGTYLGGKVGLYMPSNSEMRDIFGSSIFVFGLSVDDFSRKRMDLSEAELREERDGVKDLL